MRLVSVAALISSFLPRTCQTVLVLAPGVGDRGVENSMVDAPNIMSTQNVHVSWGEGDSLYMCARVRESVCVSVRVCVCVRACVLCIAFATNTMVCCDSAMRCHALAHPLIPHARSCTQPTRRMCFRTSKC